MARRRSVGHGIRRFPSVLEIAHNRIGFEVNTLHVHLQRFHASLDERSAYFAHLLTVSAAHEAILILNNGTPRKEAFEQVEREFEATKGPKCADCGDTGIRPDSEELTTGVWVPVGTECRCVKPIPEAASELCETCNDTFCVCSRKAA
jgi:hypothetical protein